jgi:hypothetical protein
LPPRANCRAVLGGHQLHRFRGHARRFETADQRGMDRAIGMDRLAAPAQQHGITRTQAQCSGVGSDVGPAFVDNANQSNGNANPAEAQAVRPLAGIDHLADGIGQGCDLLYGIGNASQPGRVKPQPVEHCVGQPAGLARSEIASVRGEDFALGIAQCPSGAAQRRGLDIAPEFGQLALRASPGKRHAVDDILGRFEGLLRCGHGRRLAVAGQNVTGPTIRFVATG